MIQVQEAKFTKYYNLQVTEEKSSKDYTNVFTVLKKDRETNLAL